MQLFCIFHPILITRFASAIGSGSLGMKFHETLSLVGFITLKSLSYSRIYIGNVVFGEYFYVLSSIQKSLLFGYKIENSKKK